MKSWAIDILGMIGFAVLIGGLWQVNAAAAMIVGGSIVLILAVIGARNAY